MPAAQIAQAEKQKTADLHAVVEAISLPRLKSIRAMEDHTKNQWGGRYPSFDKLPSQTCPFERSYMTFSQRNDMGWFRGILPYLLKIDGLAIAVDKHINTTENTPEV